MANAHMKELAAVYPVLNEDKAKEADDRFCKFVQSVFDKRKVSSVFLTGEGFENNWYPNSLRVLCNGRRAFIGNNLYSKGACYTAYRKKYTHIENPVYLDESKLTDRVTLNMRVNGQEEWYPVVSWGNHWYESDNQWEVLVNDVDELEFHVESLVQGSAKTERISSGRTAETFGLFDQAPDRNAVPGRKDLQDHSEGCRIRGVFPRGGFPGGKDHSFRRQ